MKSLLTTREKEKLIEEFEISRKSYATFSKEKGINPNTFTTWVYKWRKAKEEKTEVSFVKINTSILKKEAKIKIKKADIEIARYFLIVKPKQYKYVEQSFFKKITKLSIIKEGV